MTTHRKTTFGIAIALTATLILTTAPLARAATSAGSSDTAGSAGSPTVATQTIDGITFPASFPAGALNSLKVSNVSNAGAIPLAAQGRQQPRNTTNITTDLYVPGKIAGTDGQPPLAHCRNLANGGRQCVTPAPSGGW